MTDPTLTEVVFNFKTDDGASVRHKLTRKNICIGPNGSRKSAVPQAVALAVSGAVDDLLGYRVTRDPGLLTGMMHMRGLDGEPMFAKVTFDSGEKCQWETTRDGSRIKTPVHIKPKWVVPEESKHHSPHFPLREIEEVLSSSAKKAREQFLTWVCQDVEEDEVLSYLSRSEAEYRELTDPLPDLAPVDKLAHAIKQAESQTRKLNSDARANAKMREEIATEVSVKVTAEQVLVARDKVRRLEVAYEDAVRANAFASSKDTRRLLEEKIGSLRTEEQKLRDRLKTAKKFVEEMSDGDLEFDGVNGALDAYIWAESENYFSDGEDATCPFCSSDVGRAHLVACHGFYEERAQEMSAGQRDLEEAKARITNLAGELRVIDAKITDAQTALDDLPVAGDTSDIDLESVRTELANARADLESKQEAASKWTQMTKASEREVAAKAKAEKFRSLKIDGQKAVKELLAGRTESFCKRVSAYLPDGWDFDVMVEDEGRDVFYYGLLEGEGALQYLRLGLSEGQRAAVLVAIAAVLDEMNPMPLSVIILADRGWDTDTLADVLAALRKAPQHIFVTTTIDPGKPALRGWNVIRTAENHGTPSLYAKGTLPPPPAPLGNDEDEEVITNSPRIDLDPMLRADPEPMPSSRARGGKFRSAKNRALKAVEEYGLDAVKGEMQSMHPEISFVPSVTAEEFAESVAHFLFPIDFDD